MQIVDDCGERLRLDPISPRRPAALLIVIASPLICREPSSHAGAYLRNGLSSAQLEIGRHIFLREWPRRLPRLASAAALSTTRLSGAVDAKGGPVGVVFPANR